MRSIPDTAARPARMESPNAREGRALVIGLWVATGVFLAWTGMLRLTGLAIVVREGLAATGPLASTVHLLHVTAGLAAGGAAIALYHGKGGRHVLVGAAILSWMAFLVGDLGVLFVADGPLMEMARPRAVSLAALHTVAYAAILTFLLRTWGALGPRPAERRHDQGVQADV